jgi:hypothetical protein
MGDFYVADAGSDLPACRWRYESTSRLKSPHKAGGRTSFSEGVLRTFECPLEKKGVTVL